MPRDRVPGQFFDAHVWSRKDRRGRLLSKVRGTSGMSSISTAVHGIARRSARFVFLLLPFVVVASGCAVGVPIAPVEQLTPKQTPHGQSRPVMFRKLVVRIPRGQVIGSIQRGLLCLNRGKLTWRGGRAVVTDEDFGDVLREELTTAGYTVVGDPSALFEDPSAWRAEYLIAGLVKDVKANICYPRGGFGDFVSAKGEASIEVEWQIYYRGTRSVELKVSTQGAAKINEPMERGDFEVFVQAFQSAARNLLADERFYRRIALGPREDLAGREKLAPIEVAYLRPRDDAVPLAPESIIADARMAVVTVFAGEEHGSGFIISQDGYLLTNEHVVREAKYVKVRFVTGREVNGEVVRTDRGRDVALVKLEYDVYRALPLGHSSSVRPGSVVYAIGTPLLEKLGQTVTRGIVSGYREEYGRRMIQSDVNLQPGGSGGPLLNKVGAVVGVAVAGFAAPGGASLGINYFVPVEEALEALAIKEGRPR